MKTKNIFVGVNGATLQGFKGGVGIAVYPVQKGGNKSYVLLDSGKLAVIAGARINGVGVPRFLKENGFELAQPGNEAAAKLADFLDVDDGMNLVTEASIKISGELQKKFSGQTCKFVPFDQEKPVRDVVVEPNCISTQVRFDLTGGINSGMVKTVYQPGSGYMDVSVCDGWLVGPDGDATNLPRLTESKELIEQAVYAMCSCGLGTLVGAHNLVPDENPAADALFTRGSLEIALANGDRLVVGGTSDDLIAAEYLRDGVALYRRVAPFSTPKVGAVVGDIAAVLVRVAEMDAEPVKKSLKKAA